MLSKYHYTIVHKLKKQGKNYRNSINEADPTSERERERENRTLGYHIDYGAIDIEEESLYNIDINM